MYKTMETIRLASETELDIAKTFECGQCFRWTADESGIYSGVASGRAAKLWTADGGVYIKMESAGELDFWRDYFDLDADYPAAFNAESEYLEDCARYGAGIRILRQESWEALCSFILSQCNNITRIRGIVRTLCESFGDELMFDGGRYYTFPAAERLAALDAGELDVLRCGYRAPYLISAAQAVVFGGLDLDALYGSNPDEAMTALLKLPGVGAKVANCAMLYGLNIRSGFPVDVWMKRALNEHFPPDFDPGTLGEFSGLAQQYIFYYARTGGKA